MALKKWTEFEKNKLIELYPNENNEVIAGILGKTRNSVNSMGFFMGLKKSVAFQNSEKSGRSHLLKVGYKTRFQKGLVPKNKGKKQHEFMSEKGIEASKITRFKKGSFSHNRLPIGSERIGKDGFLQVKMYDGRKQQNWQQKNRVVWEKEYGPIPKGCVIRFVDGNIRNFDIENLVCVPMSRNLIQNTLTNSSILKRFFNANTKEEADFILENYPYVIELKRVQLKLNYKIKENE